MSIIKAARKQFSQEEPNSLASLRQTYSVLSHDNAFIDEVMDCFSIEQDENSMKMPLQVGNLKQLLTDINELDQQCEKIDISVNLKDIYIEHVLPNDHVLFNLFGIQDKTLIKKIMADNIIVESEYSARTDILEYYQLSRFASFLHTVKLDSMAQDIWEALRTSPQIQDKKCTARLVYRIKDKKYYIRAITSEKGYKNYGINFSILVALLAINEYVRNNHEHAFIESYDIDDSRILMSIQFGRKILLSDDMYLTLNLILQNDEIRQSSVSINAAFKVVHKIGNLENGIYIKPDKYLKEHGTHSQDMLTFSHGMNVKTAIDKISALPDLIEKYITIISKEAVKIKSLKNPAHVKEYIQKTIQNARKDYFIGYKEEIVNKLASIQVNTIFELFDLLRNIEELFGEDIKSRNFWREKLYDALVNQGKSDK